LEVYSLRARRRIGLTGTPMSNSAMDIYYPFHWVFKGPTTAFPYSGREGAKEFENQFCQHIYLDKPTGEKDANGVEIIKTVRKRIPFLADPIKFWSFIGSKVVRRTYSDPLYQQSLVNAGQKLPTLEIKKLVCDMHPQQATLMLSALQNFKDQFATMVEDAEKNKKELNEALVISQMSALRQIATSPEKMNERLGKVVYTGPNGGGKILSIKHIVETKMAAGEKVVILSDFLDMQKTCEAELKQYDPIRFQTNWDDEQREEAFREFATNPKRKVFIAGTRAVREGVDLSSANSVICCDLLWAPAFQTQAWSRTLAPTKEERTCEVYLIVSRNSLDEHMFNVFYSKMTAAEQAFDKKVLSRRAQSVDIKFFVDRVLEDTIALTMQVRDYDDNMTYIPTMNMEAFGERF
jgi:SNF2 family DNA or RNA helicase